MDVDTPNNISESAAAALEAHNAAKLAARSQQVADGGNLTSLNRLLQWSTANTPTSTEPATQSSTPSHRTATELDRDREWLDAAFPDMFAGVRQLVTQLDEATTPPDRVTVLESLQEFFLDLNYAENIDKLGVLRPVLQCARDDHPQVRAAAVWVLATAMQGLPAVKTSVLRDGGAQVLVERLSDDDAAVRAKAVMATSALLRHSDADTRRAFEAIGGPAALRARLADAHPGTRRRARFFLQHAPETNNTEFVDALLADRHTVAAFAATIPDVDPLDVADVEPAVAALAVLANRDLPGLLQVAPELPGVLDTLASNCDDDEVRDQIAELTGRMF